MKLLTAIKKAAKKAEQRHGEVYFSVKRKYGLEKEINRIRYYDICAYGKDNVGISIDCSLEDLLANDWIVEDEYEV